MDVEKMCKYVMDIRQLKSLMVSLITESASRSITMTTGVKNGAQVLSMLFAVSWPMLKTSGSGRQLHQKWCSKLIRMFENFREPGLLQDHCKGYFFETHREGYSNNTRHILCRFVTPPPFPV